MKILVAIKRLESAVGGAERVACSVCSELVRRGHDVSILTFDQPGRPSFYSIDSRVKRIDLGIGDSSRPAGFIETAIRMRALRRAVTLEGPNVTVAFMHSMFVPLAFALAGTGLHIIGSEHIVPEHYRTRRLQYLLLILATPFLKRLTVLSPAIRSLYPRFVRQSMVDMPNPVEVATREANIGAIKDSYTILSVGRLEAQKDHATLIRAFAKVSGHFPQWRLKIIGEGSLRTEIESLIIALNLKTKVALPGISSEIFDEYVESELFVLPSRYEAFGLVTAEAMCHGLPVVGFADCPGTNELILSGQTGILVATDGDRCGALAAALSQLMADPLLRQRLSRAAREAIQSKFALGQVCDRWEMLFHKMRGES